MIYRLFCLAAILVAFMAIIFSVSLLVGCYAQDECALTKKFVAVIAMFMGLSGILNVYLLPQRSSK